jgi:2-hydroxy-6-oxonona-2,4-dienedioate hydrolase
MHVEFVEIQGVPTRCMLAGDRSKQPLLLVHGLTLNCEIWIRNVEALAKSCFVIAPDMLGHGYSGPVTFDRRHTLAQKVDHLRGLLDHLEVDRFIGCGSSYGSLVTALLYFADPKRMTKLILNASANCFSPEQELVAGFRKALAGEKPNLAGGTPQYWEQRMQRTVFDLSSFPRELLMSLLTTYARRWAVDAWERTVMDMIDLEASRPFRIIDKTDRIAVDTLLLWGMNDQGAPIEFAQKALKSFPKATLVSFDRCGHLPMLEHPEKWNRTVADFVGS